MRPAGYLHRAVGQAAWRSSVRSGLGAASCVGVYVVVVLGGGVLIGRTDSPSPALSVLATAVVALAVRARAGRARTGLAHAARLATPYDVLTRFSETVSGE